MAQAPNSYQDRTGIIPISWNRFHAICKGIARSVDPFNPEMILAIGRGGYYPGTLLAHMLRIELSPVRVSRRIDDVVVHATPRWINRPPEQVRGKRVLVVDEIAGSGETIRMVVAEAKRLRAAAVISAVLLAHPLDKSGKAAADYVGIISDALFLNPWDREILVEGVFQWHPEYVQALALQGLEPERSQLIGVEPAKLAKGDIGDGGIRHE